MEKIVKMTRKVGSKEFEADVCWTSQFEAFKKDGWVRVDEKPKTKKPKKTKISEDQLEEKPELLAPK